MHGGRTGYVGYQVDEITTPIYMPTDIRVIARDPNKGDERLVVGASLGCHVEGVAMPRPDITCPKTQLAGALHRFARPMPEIDPGLVEEFRQFARNWCRDTFSPLPPETTFSLEEWLQGTSYTDEFKRNLRDVHTEMCAEGGYWSSLKTRNRNMDVHMFTKDESYTEYKHARCINGRVDAAKVFMGPVFKKLEEVLFDHPHFIKKVPVRNRPSYIATRLEGPGSLMAVDFTSLEATLQPVLMDVEVDFYNYMLSNTTVAHDAKRFFEQVLKGTNIIDGKFITMAVVSRRMSGENNTSLGNGFFCLLITLFAYYKQCGIDYHRIKSVGEGDDGLFKSPTGAHPDAPFYRRLGAIIKIERHDQASTASFCGMIYDEEELANIADPHKVLANFGLTSHTYACSKTAKQLGLLRAKALSLAYQYPRTPIFTALARAALRWTKGRDSAAVPHILRDQRYKWSLEDLKRFKDAPGDIIKQLRFETEQLGNPGPRTRQLMEEIFNVSVAKQIEIENYLDSLERVQPLTIDLDWPESWLDYAATYRVEYDKNTRVPYTPILKRHLDMRDWCKLTGQQSFYI